jgi:hypothetical protein
VTAKRVLIAVAIVAVVGVIVAVRNVADSKPAPASLVVHYVTEDAKGAPMALLELTVHGKVFVHLDFFEGKAGDKWKRLRGVSTNVVSEAAQLCRLSGGRRAAWVHFPTNQMWRLRMRIVEPRKGIGGMVERLVYAPRFYRIGGFKNVVEGRRPPPDVGRKWWVVSEEISNQ